MQGCGSRAEIGYYPRSELNRQPQGNRDLNAARLPFRHGGKRGTAGAVLQEILTAFALLSELLLRCC